MVELLAIVVAIVIVMQLRSRLSQRAARAAGPVPPKPTPEALVLPPHLADALRAAPRRVPPPTNGESVRRW